MKDEDIQNLLGGFATDTLTDREREALYTAALHNQQLFDALADEQALRELLSDPASRRQVLEALQPAKREAFAWVTSWMGRPLMWVIAGGAVAALVVVIAIRPPRPQSMAQPLTETARVERGPEVSSAPVSNPPPATQPERRESQERMKPAFQTPRAPKGAMARSNAPAVPMPAVPMPALTTAPEKMKVAVLDFDSGQPPAKKGEADSARTDTRKDAGKEASDLLEKKLDPNQFTVIDRKQVEQAMQSQNVLNRDIDASTAASVGLSVGADAVIVGSVKASGGPVGSPKGAVSSGFRSALATRSNKAAAGAAAPGQLEVTARAISTKTSGKVAEAKAPAQAGLANAVDSVASSLNQQLQQNISAKIAGLVTNVAESVLTLNVGVKEGLKVGDRLNVRRDGKPLGVVTITSVRDAEAQGTFQGDGAVQTGDSVLSQ